MANEVPKINELERLSHVREGINSLDEQILGLLAERRKLSAEAVRVKEEDRSELRDAGREHELLSRRIKRGRELGLDTQFVTRVFHEVIDDSLRIQQDIVQTTLNGAQTRTRPVKVAFHGIDGSYSYLAGSGYFIDRTSDNPLPRTEPEFVGFGTFEHVIRAVESGQCDYAMLPVENTTSGGNNEVYDLLLNSHVSIVGENKFKVEHCLIGSKSVPVSHLRRVHCTPLAVAECSHFLATIPECRVEYCTDSGLAVKRIRESGSEFEAAIGSDEAAKFAGLVVLKSDVANQEENFTRYLIVARQAKKVDLRIPSKTSLVISVAERAGSLVDALMVFRERGISMTKLESRPIPGNPWEEMFYLDFDGNADDPKVQEALGELTRRVRFIKLLGCYPSFDLPRTQVEVTSQTIDSKIPTEIPVVAKESKSKAPSGSKGYKLASREYKQENTVIDVQGIKIGDGNFLVIAGPCSVESREQIMSCAKHAKENGALILRGGVFKPRTSPYSFQGLGLEGLDLLVEAGKAFGMPVITEVMTTDEVEPVAEKADIIQIGARNMQNFSLLKAVGHIRRPVMLKRGMSSSIEEILQAVEYILSGGNQQVFICERGIRTFETATRSTLDISAVPVLKQMTHLPVFVDPSHAAGVRDLVPPLAKAAKAVGADGIIVEFHPDPEKALSDGPQALRYPQFAQMMDELRRI